jgi:hypothetical protein
MYARTSGRPIFASFLSPNCGKGIQQYDTAVDVSVPWTERPQETMSRLAATFKVAEGLVKAMTLFVLAVVALGAALGIRRRRKRVAKPAT